MTTTKARSFTVVAASTPDAASCMTHCSSLAGAIRSAKGFHPSFTSIVIRHDGEVIKVVR
jgi:hypothetical protein